MPNTPPSLGQVLLALIPDIPAIIDLVTAIEAVVKAIPPGSNYEVVAAAVENAKLLSAAAKIADAIKTQV